MDSIDHRTAGRLCCCRWIIGYASRGRISQHVPHGRVGICSLTMTMRREQVNDHRNPFPALEIPIDLFVHTGNVHALKRHWPIVCCTTRFPIIGLISFKKNYATLIHSKRRTILPSRRMICGGRSSEKLINRTLLLSRLYRSSELASAIQRTLKHWRSFRSRRLGSEVFALLWVPGKDVRPPPSGQTHSARNPPASGGRR